MPPGRSGEDKKRAKSVAWVSVNGGTVLVMTESVCQLLVVHFNPSLRSVMVVRFTRSSISRRTANVITQSSKVLFLLQEVLSEVPIPHLEVDVMLDIRTAGLVKRWGDPVIADPA